ncbi:MAG TPA: hypothetical protein VEY12_00195 [Thermoplasmata archaeon]|nr:hypothetical protein [Thermoplasmata archaeon]
MNVTASPAFGFDVDAEALATGSAFTVTMTVAALLTPALSIAVRCTAYVPAVVKVCDGLEALLRLPSAKSHVKVTGLVPPVELPVNPTLCPTSTVDFDELAMAIRAAFTVTVVCTWAEPPAVSLTHRFTVKVDAELYACAGFWAVLVAPSPNLQE